MLALRWHAATGIRGCSGIPGTVAHALRVDSRLALSLRERVAQWSRCKGAWHQAVGDAPGCCRRRRGGSCSTDIASEQQVHCCAACGGQGCAGSGVFATLWCLVVVPGAAFSNIPRLNGFASGCHKPHRTKAATADAIASFNTACDVACVPGFRRAAVAALAECGVTQPLTQRRHPLLLPLLRVTGDV